MRKLARMERSKSAARLVEISPLVSTSRGFSRRSVLSHHSPRAARPLPGHDGKADAVAAEQAKHHRDCSDAVDCDCEHHNMKKFWLTFCFRKSARGSLLTLAP